VGAAGLLIGLPLGLGIAAALVHHFRDLLPAGFAVSRLGLILTIAGSLAAGVAGAIYPSWLAGRVTPLEAMARPARPLRARSIALCIVFGVLCLLLGTGLALTGTEGFRFWSYLTVGLPLTFLAYFLLAVPVLVLLVLTLHRPLALLLRLPSDLLRGSILSRPFRHGFTGAALTVGLAIFVDSWTVDHSVMSGWIDQIRFADALAGGVPGLTPRQQQAIADLPFVEAVCPISHTQVRTIDEQVFGIEGVSPPYVQVFGFEPSVFFRMNSIDWLEGDAETAIPRLEEGDAILVADRFLVAHDVGLGDSITLGEGRVQREFEIVGVVSAAGLDIATYLFGIRSAYMEVAISAVFMDFEAAAELFNNPMARLLQVNLKDGVTDDEAERGVLAAAPGIIFFSARWIRDTIEDLSDSVLALNSAASLLALLLASLAVGAIIIANIRSRRFEYGVLRAVGGHRGLLLRLVLAEGIFIGLTGASVGAVMGLHFAALDVMFLRALAGLPIALEVPPRPILLAGAVLLILALLAAAPGGIGLLRRTPSALIAAGRNA
jgi:putative ABC transport system permease protein